MGVRFANFELKLMPLIDSFIRQRSLLKNSFSQTNRVHYNLKFYHYRDIFEMIV